ncbi:unnamed protein product [Moneuplotes crassus]|uniref:Uncharacterized protein n=1 Tax=Euplotes crassus TaxID=5936 RepID=A0AAD1UA06_EUPCR|nr:unnamed protein product [Moneuplotes crassus]
MSKLVIFILTVLLTLLIVSTKATKSTSSQLKNFSRAQLSSKDADSINQHIQLAKTYIQALQEYNGQVKSYQWRWVWSYQFMGIAMSSKWDLVFDVGWKVNFNETGGDFFHINYEPFVDLHTYMWNDLALWLAEFYYDPIAQILFGSMQLDFTLDRNGKACLNATYDLEPVYYHGYLGSTLKECHTEILSEVAQQTPIHLECNMTDHVYIRFHNLEFTPRLVDTFLDICIDF